MNLCEKAEKVAAAGCREQWGELTWVREILLLAEIVQREERERCVGKVQEWVREGGCQQGLIEAIREEDAERSNDGN